MQQEETQTEEQRSEDGSKINAIQEHLKEYARTKIAYYKLIAYEGAAKAASVSVFGALLAVFGLFFLLFLSISIAILIGDGVDNIFLGFLIVSGAYLLLGLLTFLLSDKLIKTPVTNLVIKSLANENGRDEKNNGSGKPKS